ncbi:GT-D fold domain-containing protein [Paenibacillus roseus]
MKTRVEKTLRKRQEGFKGKKRRGPRAVRTKKKQVPVAALSIKEQPSIEMSLLQQHYMEEGRQLGHYEGGEEILEKAVPPDVLLPDITLEEIIQAGVSTIMDRCMPLLRVEQVYHRLQQALEQKAPCSVVRLGDGELLALAQETVFSIEKVASEGRFLPYAGINVPDLAARDALAHAIRSADIIGVPLSRQKHYHPLLHPVLKAHHIQLDTNRTASSTINYSLQQAGLLPPLLGARSILLIGNTASELAMEFTKRGFMVSGVISPVNGFSDIARVIEEARSHSFDLALVSAGIPAVVISWRIAAELGKVSLDFGHLANFIATGQLSI